MKRLLILLFLVPGFAFASDFDGVYGGADISVRNMGFKANEGDALFAKNLTQYSLFAGMNFDEMWGGELSFFTTGNKSRDVSVGVNQTALGQNFNPGLAADSYHTKTQLTGSTLKVTARHELAECLNVVGSAGLGLARLKVKADMTSNAGVAPTAADLTANNIDEKKTKIYPVIGAGLDWKITDNFGARANVAYEGTKALKMDFSRPSNANLQVRAKNSVVYGLGVYVAV